MYGYKKISYYPDSKKVLLQFDYPDSLDLEEFQKTADLFYTSKGWTVKRSPSMNFNAASLLLSMLFKDQILKMSYYQDKILFCHRR